MVFSEAETGRSIGLAAAAAQVFGRMRMMYDGYGLACCRSTRSLADQLSIPVWRRNAKPRTVRREYQKFKLQLENLITAS